VSRGIRFIGSATVTGLLSCGGGGARGTPAVLITGWRSLVNDGALLKPTRGCGRDCSPSFKHLSGSRLKARWVKERCDRDASLRQRHDQAVVGEFHAGWERGGDVGVADVVRHVHQQGAAGGNAAGHVEGLIE